MQESKFASKTNRNRILSYEQLEEKLKTVYNNDSIHMEMQNQKIRRKIIKTESLCTHINKIICDLDFNIKNKNNKENFLRLSSSSINNEDQISTVESSSKEKIIIIKKNRNFRAISTKIKNEKDIFTKKNKIELLSNFTKQSLIKENEITEITDEIKEKFQNDILSKKISLVTLAKNKVKNCKDQINKIKQIPKSNNFDINFLLDENSPSVMSMVENIFEIPSKKMKDLYLDKNNVDKKDKEDNCIIY